MSHFWGSLQPICEKDLQKQKSLIYIDLRKSILARADLSYKLAVGDYKSKIRVIFLAIRQKVDDTHYLNLS